MSGQQRGHWMPAARIVAPANPHDKTQNQIGSAVIVRRLMTPSGHISDDTLAVIKRLVLAGRV